MAKYGVGFRGTRHEEHIEAKTMKEAKEKFAKHEKISSKSGYIKARKIA
jgi:hypothetical protein